MGAFKVLSNLRHNGIEYKVGSVIHELSDEAAHDLIALKVVEPVVEGQVEADAKAVSGQVENMVNDAKADVSTVEGQVEQDIKESAAQVDSLKSVKGEPVTHTPTPEEIAADAASVA